jgi:hypothetical protein
MKALGKGRTNRRKPEELGALHTSFPGSSATSQPTCPCQGKFRMRTVLVRDKRSPFLYASPEISAMFTIPLSFLLTMEAARRMTSSVGGMGKI